MAGGWVSVLIGGDKGRDEDETNSLCNLQTWKYLFSDRR